MFGFFFRGKRPARPTLGRKGRRFQAHLEVLEDRSVPATITVSGTGSFQDGAVTGLQYTGGNNYHASNLRSAIVGADNLGGPDTIILANGAYTMDSGQGQFAVSDSSGALTIKNGAGGISTIDARGLSRIFLNQASLTLSGIKLQNGLASNQGGAIYNNGILNIDNCQFVNNEALGGLNGGPVQGGAIFNNSNCVLNVQNSTFSGNLAVGGTSSVLFAGSADAAGGAIFFAGGGSFSTDNISACTFVNNQAQGGAGAVNFGLSSRAGYGAGGGIFADAGNFDLNVIDATFAANVAQGGQGTLGDGGSAAGGGIYFQNGGLGTDRLVNDTIVLNKALGGKGNGALAQNGVGSGGGLADTLPGLPVPTIPKVINTIVAKNTANLSSDVNGQFSSLGSNLVGDNTGTGASFNAASGDFAGTSQKPLDPGLDSLGNYGGPTQTFRPHAGSLALNRGNDSVATGSLHLTTDQRGQPRRSGSAVDIGSYEVIQAGQDKSYVMAQGSTLSTTAANGLLAGYDNPLGKNITVRLISGPATGILTLKPNGTFVYQPPKSFHGTVSFRFQVLVNGQGTDIFTATLTVTKTSGRLTL